MALTYKFYRSTIIGDGTRGNSFRSKLVNFIIEDGSGATFENFIDPQKPLCYDLARCDSTVHAQIASDADIKPISIELADDAAVLEWMNGDGFADALVNAQLESDGCSTAWKSTGTTRRDLMAYLAKLYILGLDIGRARDSDLLRLIKENLDNRINQLPVAVRNKVTNWMVTKGLDAGWIGGQTTVRQVLHYVIENVQWPKQKLIRFEF
jgi:hypothetical protein